MITRTEFFTIDDFIMAGYNWVKENKQKIYLVPVSTKNSFDVEFIMRLPNNDEMFINYKNLKIGNDKILHLCANSNVRIEDLINKQLLTFL